MGKERPSIHLVPHFHYDPVWIEDQRTYTRQAFDLIGQYLESCRQDEVYHVLLHEIDYLRPFLASVGDEREFLKESVAMGRVGTGGSYSQPNEMTLQGEPLIRNLLYGRLYCREVLGATPRVYLPLDVFGHCVQLPQLAAKAGFEAIVWSKDIVGAPPICRAMAPDGTSLVQKHEHYWYYPETLEEFLDTVADGLESQAVLGLSQDLRFLGHDMAAARPWLANRSSELAEMDPSVRFSTPDKYLAAVGPEIRARRATLPISGRDFSWYHAGTLVTRADLKIANRMAENRVLSAEKWATLAGLLGAVYPDAALDKAWRQVLFGQHHDAVTGVSSDIPFLDLLAGYRDALELAGEVEDKALAYIAGRADTAAGRRAPREGTALVVFNSLGWTRTDVCRARIPLPGELAGGFRIAADDGRRVPCQITARSADDEHPWVDVVFVAPEIPSLGYRTFYVAPDRRMPEEASSSGAAEGTIENEFLRVTADANMGGALSSIYSKRLRREFVDLDRGPAGDLVVLSEKADREMAPWELWTTGEISRCGESPARVEVLTGPVFSQLRVTATMPERCTVVREFTLYQGLDRLELRTILDQYRGQHELVVLTFPFDLPAASPIFEDRFAVVARRRSQGRLDFRTHEGKNTSRCGLGAAQNWIDVGPGPSLTIMSGRRPVGAVPLSPCVIVTSEDLRARAAARVLLQALQSRGVTCTHRLDSEDPEGDPAACAFTISLGRDNEYSAKLLGRFPQAASRLTELNGKLPWGGVLLHRADPSGEWPEVPVLVADTSDEGGIARLGELLAEAVRADELRLPQSQDFSELAQPAPDCGVALVNRGTLAASLESDGTLVAPLFHTSSWSTHSWGEGRLSRFFVPEHKSHVFEHTLHPHPGDWREGGLVHVGHEANNPLRVSQVKVGTGVLPTSFSLVSIDSPSVVLAALKPLGNPLAEHKVTKNSLPQNGILIRLYESQGQPVEVGLRFPTTVDEAWLTDLTEERTGDLEAPTGGRRRQAGIRVPIGACELTSLAARLGPLAESGPAEQLGPTSEPQAPLHSRYWDHNAGAAPLGNQPVTLWMRGPVPIGATTRFTVGVTNDALDREIAGSVTMIAPEEWTMIPRQLPYRIPPDSPSVYEVMVVVPPEARPCFIRAVAEAGEQMVQDVLPIGEIAPLEVSLQRGEDGFLVSLRNPNEDYVEGEVTLVTPVESWGRSVDTLALSNVAPRSHVFRIDGGQEQGLPFAVSGGAKGLWAVAKVAWYGNVQYVQESEPV